MNWVNAAYYGTVVNKPLNINSAAMHPPLIWAFLFTVAGDCAAYQR